MTENIYGIWKRRFPIIRCLHVTLENAQKIILATAILHNLSVLWQEILPDNHPDLIDGPDGGYDDIAEDDIMVQVALTPRETRRVGFQTRENMRQLMNQFQN